MVFGVVGVTGEVADVVITRDGSWTSPSPRFPKSSRSMRLLVTGKRGGEKKIG